MFTYGAMVDVLVFSCQSPAALEVQVFEGRSGVFLPLLGTLTTSSERKDFSDPSPTHLTEIPLRTFDATTKARLQYFTNQSQ